MIVNKLVLVVKPSPSSTRRYCIDTLVRAVGLTQHPTGQDNKEDCAKNGVL